MNHQQQHQPIDPKKITGLGIILVRGMAVTLEVFLHTGFGVRYIGSQALIGILVIAGWAMLAGPRDEMPLIMFGAAVVVLCGCQRIDAAIRRKRGIREHSRYTGYPWLLPRTMASSESAMKGVLEPMLAGAIGWWIAPLSPPLGTYLMLASVALFLSNLMDERAEAQQALDLDDAMMDQIIKSQQFRQRNGRW